MVNNNQKFRKTKIALAVVLTIGLTACGVDGDAGNVSNSTSNTQTDATQNTVGNQQLSGSVTGVVLDTNNVPVVGASVFLAGVEATTDAGGVYYFDNVAVTNVSGSDGSVGTALVISIVSENHLGATVTVTPEAQVNSSDTSTAATSSVHTYIDGFLAQAGTAIIPTITTRTFGYLRDCDTGAPLVGGKVVFDFAGLVRIDVSDSGSVTTVPVGNVASAPFTAMTNDDGMFDILLPDDSLLTYLVTDYAVIGTVVDAGTQINTQNEGVDIFLGTSEVCSTAFDDGTPAAAPVAAAPPKVASIVGQMTDQVITGDANSTYDEIYSYALLNEGFVNDFVINFSEVMSEGFDLTQARVKVNGVVIADAVVARTDDGASATVTFVTDLVGADTVDVWFPNWNATDDDGEFLEDDANITFDTAPIMLADGNASYTHVFFTTFLMPTGDGSVTFDAQVIDADDTEELTAYSSAFSDNIDGDSTTGELVSQLNGDANTTARLIALGNEIKDGSPLTGEFDSDFAVVPFDVSASPGGYEFSGDVAVASEVGGLAQFSGAAHGDEVTLTPKNGWGDLLPSLAVTTTLKDSIAPTVVLQESYDITTAGAPQAGNGLTLKEGTFNANFGDGGEISGAESGAVAEKGNPILYVQPRLLAGRNDRGDEFKALAADMVNRLSQTEVDNNVLTTPLTVNATHALYDATAFAAWGPVSAEIGVAFSENLVAAEGTPSYNGTAANITGYTINNDVAVNVAGIATNADLVDFVTADVMSLANDDAGSMLEFVDAYQDAAGNVITAASNAKIMIQDAMPPMIVSAKWLGATFVVEFNESIDTESDVTLTVSDPEDAGIFVDITLTDTTPLSGNTYTVTGSGFTSVFVDGSFGEFLYDETGDTAEEKHAVISWDDVPDATGNKWADFVETVDNDDFEVISPRFLAYSDVSDFDVSASFTGLEDTGVVDSDGFSVSIFMTHTINVATGQDIKLADVAVNNDDDNFFESAADINAFFYIDINKDGLYTPGGTEDFAAGATAVLINTGTSARIDIIVPATGAPSFTVGDVRIIAKDDAADPDTIGGVTSSITGTVKAINVLIQ